MNEDEKAEIAISKLKELTQLRNWALSPVVRHCKGYIILAQNDCEYKMYADWIDKGKTLGFYTIEGLISMSIPKRLLKLEGEIKLSHT